MEAAAEELAEPLLASPEPKERKRLLPRREVLLQAFRLFLACVPIVIIKTLLPLRILELVDGRDARANAWYSRVVSTANAATLCTTCLLCASSDFFGRRAPLAIVCAGTALDAVVCALAPTPGLLWAGHAVAYALGGSTWALLALSFASTGDVLATSPPRALAVEFAFVEGSVFLSIVGIPAAAACLAQRLGNGAAFSVAAVFGLGASALCLAADETLPGAPRPWTRRDARDWTPLGALRFFAQPNLRLAGLACFAHWLGMRGEEYLMPLVADRQFALSETQQGLLASVAGAGAVVSTCFLVRLVSGDECTLAAKFATVGALGLACVGASGWCGGASEPIFVASTALYAVEMPANPALRGVVAHRRGDAGLGLALGAAAFLETLSQLVASVAYKYIYAGVPGTSAYFVAAASMAVAVPLALKIRGT